MAGDEEGGPFSISVCRGENPLRRFSYGLFTCAAGDLCLYDILGGERRSGIWRRSF